VTPEILHEVQIRTTTATSGALLSELIMRRMNVPTLVMAVTFVLASFGSALSASRGVFDSPHNFSASRQAGDLSFGSTEERICIFCHAPHHANSEGALWNRDISVQDNYRMYESPTLAATIEPMPTGASRLCLSCHDGTIAIGALQGNYILTASPTLQGNPNQLALVDGSGLHDLSGDHPISFFYPVKDGLVAPQSIPKPVTLAVSDRVECTACHNPHSNDFGNFLVLNNSDGVKLCTSCHLTPGWVTSPASAHKVNIVSDNQGCANCHIQHKAPGRQYLLKNGAEEKNCLTAACHTTVTATFTGSLYTHSVINQYSQIHTPNETLPVTQKHVKCADCHSPHQANNLSPPSPLPLSPPVISDNGPLSGVRGITSSATERFPAKYGYEICFRCHSGGAALNFVDSATTLPSRLWSTFNELDRFSATNKSYHPVTQVTHTPTSSVLASLTNSTPNQIITCTACHSNHGSSYPHQLVSRYDGDVPLSTPSFSNYQLCFNCHNQINGYTSGFVAGPKDLHASHVYPASSGGRKPVPCSGCHDPHGVALYPHLINLDRNLLLATPVPSYSPSLTGGSCTVSCHSTGNPDPYTHSYP
jgi:predicted CXXCH cytochrome family protein